MSEANGELTGPDLGKGVPAYLADTAPEDWIP